MRAYLPRSGGQSAVRWDSLAAALALLALVSGGCSKHGVDLGSDAAALKSTPLPEPSVAASAPARGLPMPASSIEAIVNPGKLPPYTGPRGAVEGTITITGDPSPDVPGSPDFSSCPEGAKTYGKIFREGPPDATGARPVADAIVAVTGYEGFYLPEPTEAKAVRIERCAYPRTITMTFGQRLEITNDTAQMWAPALANASLPALMIATPKADPVKLYPPHPGYFLLVDRLAHSYAHADVWALLQPLHGVSDLGGHYRIDHVPVGKLKVHALLNAVKSESEAPVEILENGVAQVNLTLKFHRMEAAKPAPSSSSPTPTVQ